MESGGGRFLNTLKLNNNRLGPLKSCRWFLVLLLSASVLLVTGCKGCRSEKDQMTAEEKKKEEEEKKEKEKPTFESKAAVFYPGVYEEVIRRNRVKRGHWVTTDFQIVSNKSDASGELTATSYSATAPIAINNTNYYSVSSRPFSIAKSEDRNLATNVYIPRRENSSGVNVNYEMRRGVGGLPMFSAVHSLLEMRAYQHHMVLLTNRADDYSYLKIIDSVTLPGWQDSALQPMYVVVPTRPADWPIPLPRQALYWTTIAYLIWDDLEVDQLDEEQRQAMVDWIHFGGQLIVSGPDSLEKLDNSFLADYLPAKFKQTRNLSAADFKDINENWAVPVERQPAVKRKIVLTEKSKILGVEFDVHPESNFVDGTGSLAVERSVGRGRIVVTSFSLRSKPVFRWPGYRSFFNGCLLRRPARRFGTTMDGTLSFAWNGDASSPFDPLLGSTLRYISSDLGFEGTAVDPNIDSKQVTGFNIRGNAQISGLTDTNPLEMIYPRFKSTGGDNRNLDDDWHYGGFQHDQQSGTAGWNDDSAISIAANETLRRAAGISPPSSAFVLKMLSVYLLVLVPLNWLVFRLMGRVEWAWIAAPLIAIGGAYMVVRMASLDIGFVRSNSQVASIEIFADYPRAHVAQYSALYTSLSTGYDVDLDNPSAQSLPLGLKNKLPKQKSNLPVTFRRTVNNRLEGLQVQSNSTALLHTEMMFDIQGVFSYDEEAQTVQNSTLLNLENAAVIMRRADGSLWSSPIGEFASGTAHELDFRPCKQVTSPWNDSKSMTLSVDARTYWKDLVGTEFDPDAEEINSIRLVQLRSYSGTAADWQKYLSLASQLFPQADPETLLETELNFQTLSEMVAEVRQSSEISTSRLFSAVANDLTLGRGEVRLFATTNQSVGNNKFNPESTQTHQQSLAIVHLKRPALPAARRDINSIEDFSTGDSNLTVDNEPIDLSEFEGEDFGAEVDNGDAGEANDEDQ